MSARTADVFEGFDLSRVRPGFSNPVMDAQSVFKKVLDAISYPGRITRLGSEIEYPEPLNMASASIFLALADYSTPVWTDANYSNELFSWLKFHCSADILEEPGQALFAMISDPQKMPDLCSFNHGTGQRPDSSATLVVQTKGLGWKNGFRISGPGIPRSMGLKVEGIPDVFWLQRKRMEKLFPLGVDVFFTCGDSLVALPRTTVVSDV